MLLLLPFFLKLLFVGYRQNQGTEEESTFPVDLDGRDNFCLKIGQKTCEELEGQGQNSREQLLQMFPCSPDQHGILAFGSFFRT